MSVNPSAAAAIVSCLKSWLTELQTTWAQDVEFSNHLSVQIAPLLGTSVVCIACEGLGNVRDAQSLVSVVKWRVKTFEPAALKVVGVRELGKQSNEERRSVNRRSRKRLQNGKHVAVSR